MNELESHQWSYDSDCGEYFGCDCGEGTDENGNELPEFRIHEHQMQVLLDAGWTPPEILISHNHLTRDVKALGECPACDAYYIRR